MLQVEKSMNQNESGTVNMVKCQLLCGVSESDFAVAMGAKVHAFGLHSNLLSMI